MINHTSSISVGRSSPAPAFSVCHESKEPRQFSKDGRHVVEKSNFLGENLEARPSAVQQAKGIRHSHGKILLPNRDDGLLKALVRARALERRQSSLDSWPDDGGPRITRWDKVNYSPKEQWKPSRPARRIAVPRPSTGANDRDADDRGRPVEGVIEDRRDAEAEAQGGPVQPIQRALAEAKREAILLVDYFKSFDPHRLFSSTGEHASYPPFPPVTGTLIAGLGAVLMAFLVLDALIWRVNRAFDARREKAREAKDDQGDSLRSRAPSALSVLLERDLRRKESVEWVNMVVGKFWNLYRRGVESWLVDLLQPIIDDLEKPDYVKKVEVKQFFLGDEPLTVRTVERRTSRRADDLQYHIGVRYTGGARLLLAITLKAWIIPITIPVGVRGLDVDAEVWVKLRMVPYEPWIGQATWAFVNLPKIKLVLAPFRLLNLMAIPFLSIFLAKLLTEDLPMLFVRPNKNVVDLLEGRVVGPLSKDFKDGIMLDGTRSFSGELSVTLVEARRAPYIPVLKTDPYCIFVLGEQVRRSKRNSQTSIIGAPGAPVWNQDFKLLVVDQKAQHLSVTLHDTLGFTSYPIGSADIDLRTLQDTVPIDRKLTLRSGWGPFPRRFAGELILRLTYKAYIEEDGEDEFAGELTPKGSAVLDVPGAVEQVQEVATFFKEEAGKVAEFFEDKEGAKEMFASLPTISSDKDVEKALPILGLEPGNGKANGKAPNKTKPSARSGGTGNGAVIGGGGAVPKPGVKVDKSTKDNSSGRNSPEELIVSNQADQEGKKSSVQVESVSTNQLVLWLAVATGVVWIVAADLNLTNLFNP